MINECLLEIENLLNVEILNKNEFNYDEESYSFGLKNIKLEF